jgi:hypothetical protein
LACIAISETKARADYFRKNINRKNPLLRHLSVGGRIIAAASCHGVLWGRSPKPGGRSPKLEERSRKSHPFGRRRVRPPTYFSSHFRIPTSHFETPSFFPPSQPPGLLASRPFPTFSTSYLLSFFYGHPIRAGINPAATFR